MSKKNCATPECENSKAYDTPYCKECNSERARNYYQRNKEKVRQRATKYYYENKADVLVRRKKHYELNRESVLEAQAVFRQTDRHKENVSRWREVNRESIAAHREAYRQENKQSIREYQKEWRKRNKEHIRSYERRRRALKLRVRAEVYTVQDVLGAYGTNCHICQVAVDLSAPRLVGLPGWEKGLHLDHVIPLALGGSDSLNNVKPSHALCNLKKHTKLIPLRAP